MGVTEQKAMNKPGKSRLRPLSDLLHKTLGEAFAKQGFASTEIVTRWTEIVGSEIAAHSERDGGEPFRVLHPVELLHMSIEGGA